jgi:hypothetical protein
MPCCMYVCMYVTSTYVSTGGGCKLFCNSCCNKLSVTVTVTVITVIAARSPGTHTALVFARQILNQRTRLKGPARPDTPRGCGFFNQRLFDTLFPLKV